MTARALLNSAELGKTDGTPTGNALKGAAELVVESRLSNTSRFTGASTTAYYLFAAPADSPVLVGYLDGKQSPTIETQAANFDVLGQSWRVYFDYGCALGDHRAAVKATGQA